MNLSDESTIPDHPGPQQDIRIIEQLLRCLRDHLRQVPLHLDAQLPQGHLRQVWVLILGARAQRTREQWDDHVMHRNFTMHREKKHINK